jgi:hypothetical protein
VTVKENNQARETNVLDSTGEGTSQEREKITERGKLTDWRAQGQVRDSKETRRARVTHILEGAGRGASQ